MDTITYVTMVSLRGIEWTESHELGSVEFVGQRAALRIDGRVQRGYWVTSTAEGITTPEKFWTVCEVEMRAEVELGTCKCRNCRD